jgi:hypothetical protein
MIEEAYFLRKGSLLEPPSIDLDTPKATWCLASARSEQRVARGAADDP